MELNHLNNKLLSSILDTGSITSRPWHVVSVVRLISDLDLISACFCVLYKYVFSPPYKYIPVMSCMVGTGNGQVYQLLTLLYVPLSTCQLWLLVKCTSSC